jgi:signal transduction histidine kinase
MERQHRRESLEYAAGRAALAVEGRLAAVEEQLAQGHGIRLSLAGLGVTDGAPVLFQPEPAPDANAPATVFAAAELLEFQRKDAPGAAKEYRHLADSADLAVRAGALVRLGRVLRGMAALEDALQTYARLRQLGFQPVDGQPAELIARQGACRIYAQAGDAPRLRNEVAGLQHALYSGAAPIDRATFALYRDMLREWGGAPPPAAPLARTEAAIALWRTWRAGDLAARGRRIPRGEGQPVLAVWTGGPDRPVAWLAPPAEMGALLDPAWAAQHLTATIYDPDGQRLFGPELSNSVTLTPGETRLPFLLRLTFQPGQEDTGAWRSRRTLLMAGLLFTFALMLSAAYGLQRATAREMALVRQQSDFVSAVSHEFRTPITSMRHLTELLTSNSVPTEARKSQYYELLARETERLHRLVESLLSFGRMQAGSYAWRLEAADTGDLVRGVVEEFRREPQSRDREVVCEAEAGLPRIQADREALSRAVSNLLENAGKYSDPGTPIRVVARRSGGAVHISVEDHGAGIPPEEQAKVFERFVRGAEARRAGIRGIGVGLALVKSVAEAHGGSVLLRSEPGRGSTFTLVIPCHES